MSQFDFPRLNFTGRAEINVCTSNNDDYRGANGFGLADPITSKVVIPPRIYVTNTKPLEKDFTVIKEGNFTYVEIETVNTDDDFVTWAKAKLGTSGLDAQYEPVYKAAGVDGLVPSEWNYWGSMHFYMGTADHPVLVDSIAVKEAGAVTELTAADANFADLTDILGAQLNFYNQDGDPTTGTGTGTMIDLNNAGVSDSQIFCEVMTLRKGDTPYFSAQPTKATTRWINFSRITNVGGPLGASGYFMCAIPLADIKSSPIVAAMTPHLDPNKTFKGIFIRYNLVEVFENRTPDYATNPEKNPAFSTVNGSITPWYDDELASVTMGHYLNTDYAFKPTVGTRASMPLAPAVARVDGTNVSIDLVNTLPENAINYEEGVECFDYELYEFGEVNVKAGDTSIYKCWIGTAGNNINDLPLYDYKKFIETSGMLDFDAGSVPSGLLSVTATFDGTEQSLLSESQYMIASDQACLYAEQNAATGAYLNQKLPLEACKITIYEGGAPITAPIDITVQTFQLNDVFNLTLSGHSKVTLNNGDALELATDQAGVCLYNLAPTKEFLSAGPPLGNGFFVTCRTLMEFDYSQYLDKSHPNYTKPTFEILYNEIFCNFYMLYPAMVAQLNFKDFQSWENAIIAGRLEKVVQLNMFDQPWYMPRTRDLSQSQRDLINAWVQENYY